MHFKAMVMGALAVAMVPAAAEAAVFVTSYTFIAANFTAPVGIAPQPVVTGSYTLSYDDAANTVTLTDLAVPIGATNYTEASSGFQQASPFAPGPDSGVGALQPGPTFFGGKVYQLDEAQDDFLIRAVYGPDYATVTPQSFQYTTAADGLNTTYTAGSFAIAAAPEPATWAMLIAGFGLAGAALRGRRRQRVTA